MSVRSGIWRTMAACAALAIWAGGSASGARVPGQAPQAPATFRAGVQTVAIYATVRDRRGRLVPDLDQSAFRVFDNGREVPVTMFSNEPQPLTAAVMLDMSASMTSRYLRLRNAMLAFIAAMAPRDRARIGSFGLEIALSPLLTGDHDELARIVREELWPGGATPLWNATRAAMASLEGETGRRVVLVITDGDDSRITLPGWPSPDMDALTRQALDEAFMIYAIGFEGPGLDKKIISLSERTGGGHDEVPAGADLTATLAQIAAELRQQYVIGFSPAALDGRTHKLQVRAAGDRYVVRARDSYLAVPDGPR